MKFSEDLAWRGLIKDKTFENSEWLDSPKTFYHGVDASSDSLTVGNLAAIVLARRFIEAGWSAVLLAGGATSLIGDPGGKAEERDLKPREEIAKNIEAIKKQLHHLFSGKKFELVDNYDWLSEVKYLDFLRDVGKHFSMTELMQRDFVNERMGEHGSGISYAEFSYSLVQGYDFWQLYKNHKAVLQIGGSDQWGNMLSGVSLIRKKESVDAHAMSMPLVVDKKTGRKFGKSEAGAIWLDPSKTNPTQFYQFWINAEDDSVEQYLKTYTMLSKEEIEEVLKNHVRSPEKRIAQTALADSVTELVHGKGSDLVQGVTSYLNGSKSLTEASETDLDQIRAEVSSHYVSPGDSVVTVLVAGNLASSNSDARRLISSGAIYLDGNTLSHDVFTENDIKNDRMLLRRGKAYKDSILIERQ